MCIDIERVFAWRHNTVNDVAGYMCNPGEVSRRINGSNEGLDFILSPDFITVFIAASISPLINPTSD